MVKSKLNKFIKTFRATKSVYKINKDSPRRITDGMAFASSSLPFGLRVRNRSASSAVLVSFYRKAGVSIGQEFDG